MGWGSWFSSVAAVGLGAAVFSTSSLAFQLNPEDRPFEAEAPTSPKEKAADVQNFAAPLLVSDGSNLEPAFEKRFGGSQQAENVAQRPVAAAPPVRLLPGASPPKNLPLPTTIASAASTSPSFMAANGPLITGIRLGQHSDKTRVVLDISGKTDFSYGVSESGTAVIFNFSQVDWRSDRPSRRLTGLVSGYSFNKGSKGEGLLGIETKNPVKVQKVFVLPPSAPGSSPNGGQRAGYRIVLDLTDALTPEPVSNAAMGTVKKAATVPVWKRGSWPGDP